MRRHRSCAPSPSVAAPRRHLLVAVDDLHVVTLPRDLIAAPPLELWPQVVRRVTPPDDVETSLLADL